MDRRTFLATGVAGVAGLTGCLGDSNGEIGGDDGSAGSSDDGGESTGNGGGSGPDPSAAVDPNPDLTMDGLAPDPNPDAVADISPDDPSTFNTYQANGYDVPLVPIETARYWYHNRQARFVDARSPDAYESAHIAGAVSSPYDTPLSTGGVEEWNEPTRVVTYCRCPHTLSSMRASELYDAGYEAVFGIDEGFGPWLDNDYPVAGESSDDSDMSVSWDVTGYTTPADAGEFAWITHDPTAQREATRIAPDGSFSMTLHFVDVDPTSRLALETPSAELVAPARDLVGRTIDLTD